MSRPDRTLHASFALLAALACAGCSKSPDVLRREAARELAANEPRPALISLKKLLQKLPEDGPARAMLGDAELRLGDVPQALADLRSAVQFGAAPEATDEFLATVLLRLGSYDALLKEVPAGRLKDPMAQARILVLRGKALLALGRLDEAESAYRSATALAPNSPSPYAALAVLRMVQRRGPDARAALDKALALGPTDAETRGVAGRIALAENNTSEAMTDFTAALDFATTHRPPQRDLQHEELLELAALNLRLGHEKEALAALDRAEPLGVTRASQLLRARIAIEQRDNDTARTILEKLLARAPKDREAEFLLGAVDMAAGDTAQAEMHLESVLAGAPGNVAAGRMLAQLRLAQHRPEDALAGLEKLIAAGDMPSVGMAVNSKLALGDRPDAIAILDKASASSAGADSRALELARGYLVARDPKRALETLDRAPAPVRASTTADRIRLAALAMKPDVAAARALAADLAVRKAHDVDAQRLLSDFAATQGDAAGASEAIERAVALAPTDTGVLIRAAQLAAQGGDAALAEQRIAAAVASNPKASLARQVQAELAARRRDWVAALDAIREAEKSSPRDTGALLIESQIQLAKGDPGAAVAAADKAAAIQPTDPGVLQGRASALIAAKRPDEAVEALRVAVNKRPDDLALKLLLVDTLRAAGRLDDALGTASDAARAYPRSSEALSKLGILQVFKGDVEGVGHTISALRRVRANDPMASALEGELALHAKNFRGASEAFHQANLVAPSTRFLMADYSARQLGGLPGGRELLASWLHEHPADTTVMLAQAEERRAANDADGALAAYDRVLAVDPHNIYALNNAAWIEMRRGNGKAALTLGEKAYAVAPGAPSVADTYGWILSETGQPQRAVEVLAAARQTATMPTLEYHYAAALARTGRDADARSVLTPLVNRSPGFPEQTDAQKLLASLK